MQSEYGQRAPELPDGSLLLNEVKLSAEQTEEIKHDIELTGKVMDGGKRALSLSSVATFALVAGYLSIFVLALMGAGALTCLIVLITLLVLSEINKRVFRASVVSSARALLAYKSRPLIASSVRNFWAASDTHQQNTQHMNLMLHKEIQLGDNDTYRLLLDVAVPDSYVLRLVQKPASPKPAP